MYFKSGDLVQARNVFDEMPETNSMHCKVSELLNTGRQIHCLRVKNGLLVFASVGNALVTMYAKCGSLDDALQALE
ncbi:hypothetical protein V6N11_039038 [Hibiscus sabdariffa]|uniref:Pentatricopeptide repeat-containing protein n=1 Tax=Hibiscus sabdariffa TaxID=183260 RepID=A0ABR2SM29_9ROSI